MSDKPHSPYTIRSDASLMLRVKGSRQRPRVAFLGSFSEQDTAALEELFPTTYWAENHRTLDASIDARDVDLLVIGSAINAKAEWDHVSGCHVISFSESTCTFPGPCAGTVVGRSGPATTIEFAHPELTLRLSRLLDRDFSQVDSIKGWPRMEASHTTPYFGTQANDPLREASPLLRKGALVVELATGATVSFQYLRKQRNGSLRGVASLPRSVFNRPHWVRALVSEWAANGCTELGVLDDWKSSSTWQTKEERKLADEITDLEDELARSQSEIQRKITEIAHDLQALQAQVDCGCRRLITEQDEELVDAVQSALEDAGFRVLPVDDSLGEQDVKVEDLRPTLESNEGWVGLVEVRGYARSTHKNRDLQRLERFAKLFQQHQDRFPNVLVYVVNGQIDLPPGERQPPFAASEADVVEFAQSDGLLIWSVDLYRMCIAGRHSELREAILQQKGRLEFDP